jgi:hypothetical protein
VAFLSGEATQEDGFLAKFGRDGKQHDGQVNFSVCAASDSLRRSAPLVVRAGSMGPPAWFREKFRRQRVQTWNCGILCSVGELCLGGILRNFDRLVFAARFFGNFPGI